MYPLKIILFSQLFLFFAFECPSRFGLQLQGEGTYQKKLDVKTFLFCSSSNMDTQRCNGRKRRLSKWLSLVQKNYKNIILEMRPVVGISRRVILLPWGWGVGPVMMGGGLLRVRRMSPHLATEILLTPSLNCCLDQRFVGAATTYWGGPGVWPRKTGFMSWLIIEK